MARANVTEETFIRVLPQILKRKLYAKLDINGFWERLAEQIPKNCENIFDCEPLDPRFEPRYTSVAIDGFERAGNQRGGSPSKSLFTDLGSTNIAVKHLVLALNRAQLTEPANILTNYFVTSPQPAALSTNDTSNNAQPNSSENISPRISDAQPTSAEKEEVLPVQSATTISHGSGGDCECSNEALVEDDRLAAPDFRNFQQKIDISDLKKITDNFDARCIIGEGGFGDVYLGTYQDDYKVAIKRLRQNKDEITEEQKKDYTDQFETEVETLSRFHHENVVLLLGYSLQEDAYCLVYQFMENGSLEERLARRHNTLPLSIARRLDIIKGTARGIAFLNNNGVVHRDIKSANILLDEHFVPKIGDFATAKVVPDPTIKKTFELQVSKVIGTAAYLAPEALTFIAHPKLDSYSFGVILLEILTGLPVIDENRNHPCLKDYVGEYCYIPEDEDEREENEGEEDEESGTIYDLLDKSVGVWEENMVEEMYKLSERCLEKQRRRPKIADILPNIEKLDVRANL